MNHQAAFVLILMLLSVIPTSTKKIPFPIASFPAPPPPPSPYFWPMGERPACAGKEETGCRKSSECQWFTARLAIEDTYIANYCTPSADDSSSITWTGPSGEEGRLPHYDSCLEYVKTQKWVVDRCGGKENITFVSINVNSFGSHQYQLGCLRSDVATCIDNPSTREL